jgi:hypothetical protein
VQGCNGVFIERIELLRAVYGDIGNLIANFGQDKRFHSLNLSGKDN